MILRFDTTGEATCLHTDKLPLHEIGALDITRASNVEFNVSRQKWQVKLAGRFNTGNVVDFEHERRDVCIAWEIEHIESEL